MLRDLGKSREDGTPFTRKGENDPADSVFVVLFGEDVPREDGSTSRSWNVASVWLTLGEAQGAARRYQTEGHRAQHGWQVVMVMEYQTGQLAPHAERHGDELTFQPAGAIGPTEMDRIQELEFALMQLRAKLGQQQVVGTSS